MTMKCAWLLPAIALAAVTAAADPCPGRAAPVPGLSAAPCEVAEAAGHDALPPDAALVATEQAIQLDALIGWVRRQASIDPNAPR